MLVGLAWADDLLTEQRAPLEKYLLLEEYYPARQIAFARNGRVLAASTGLAGGKELVVIFDVESRKVLHRINQQAEIHALAFSPNGATLACGEATESDQGPCDIVLVNVNTGAEIARMSGHRNDVTGLAFSTDGKTLFSTSEDGSLRLWNVNDFSHRKSIITPEANPPGKRPDEVCGLALSPAGDTLVFHYRGKIRFWAWNKQDEHGSIEVNRPHHVQFSHDGQYLGVALANEVLLFDFPSGKKRWELSKRQGMTISQDCTLLAAISPHREFELYCLPTGKPVGKGLPWDWGGRRQGVRPPVLFSPTNNTLVATTSGELVVVDVDEHIKAAKAKP
jgi:hypothetical protein